MTTDRIDYVALVKKFHKAFKLPAPETQQRGYMPDDQSKLRTILQVEETVETIRALSRETFDVVEIADGICDCIYIAAGTAVTIGMAKLPIENTIVVARKTKSKEEDVFQLISLLSATVFRLNKALNDEYMTKLGKYIVDVIVACERIAVYFNIPIDKCFEEVHKSNMSKLNAKGEPVYIKKGPRKGKVTKSNLFKEPDLKSILC